MNIDPKYDAALVANTNGSAPNPVNIDALSEALPLMLVSRDQEGFSKTLAAPVAGSLGEGDQRDSTLGTWVSLSQADWAGGALERSTLAASNRYASAIADTRYAGKATLPPKVYGPYALPAAGANHVQVRWLRYQDYLFCACGGKLYRSVLNESAVSGAEVIANWASISTDAVFTALTDMDILEESILSAPYGAYIVAVDGTANSKALTMAGAVVSGTTVYPKYLNTLSYGKIGVMQYPGTAPEYAATYPRADLFTGATGGQVLPNASGVVANGIFALGANVYVVCNFGVYVLGSTPMARVVAFNQYEGLTVGRVNGVWKGAAYFGSGDSLIKFDGSTVVNVGLDREARVDSSISMKPRMLVPTEDTLYMLTGETGKKCAIWAMTGDAVWHCLYVTASSSTQIYSIGLDNRVGKHTTSGLAILQLQPRLWWGEGANTYYMYVGANVSGVSAVSPALGTTFYRGFASSGEVVSSWWGGKYAQVPKVLRGVLVPHYPTVSGIGANDVQVDLEVDKSGVWVALTLDKWDEVQHSFITTAGTWTGVSVVSVTDERTVVVNDATAISAGAFVRVGAQVLQVKSKASNTLTLVRAMRSLMTAGEAVTPARPVGYEFRTRVRLATSDSSKTPEVTRVSVEMAYSILQRLRFTLYVRLENKMSTRLRGIDYPYSAEVLRSKLEMWMKRPDPFWVLLPDGTRALVRGVNGNESQFVASDPSAPGVAVPQSVMTLTLLEMEDRRA